MAGIVIPIVPPRAFDFSWMSSNSQVSVVLKRDIDVSEWVSASLIVRVTTSSVVEGASINVTTELEGTTSDDPGQEFVTSPFTHATIDDAIVAPRALISRRAALGPGLRVSLVATRGATAGDITAMFSVDICLKNAPPVL